MATSNLKFRELHADEIYLRVNEVQEDRGKVTLLLYPTSRTVMNLLDETVGVNCWQRKHYEIKGRNYCSLGIYFEDRGWVWKDDCGTESNTEKEKGEASDAFKRAAVNWGIARELYTAPRIIVDCELIEASARNGGKKKVPKRGISWKITNIEYKDGVIVALNIQEYYYDKPQREVFAMTKNRTLQETGKQTKPGQEARIKAPTNDVPFPPEDYKCSICGEVIEKSLFDGSIKKYGAPLCSKKCLEIMRKAEQARG